ncbi:MAG: MFS transporter [Prevotellaceae bacterium]|jgi:dipeptide/tripeptide permease|nr:MFS transporter [Prevotellaceae bacterium]
MQKDTRNINVESGNSAVNKKGFPRNYWIVILMEFFERGSYYGVMSVLSVYLTNSVTEGGLGISFEQAGLISSVTKPLLYLLPILSGAIADRYGYRKLLMGAFVVMSIGYYLTGISTGYETVFASLLLMNIGAGFFKPLISGTIAHTTNEENSGLGFGIYYWSINLGAFIFPLILIPILKGISYGYIFYMAAIATGLMLFLNIFLYKEPKKHETDKPLSEVLMGALMVLTDFRFVIMIVIYSMFWILYFQMYDSVLWYVKDYVDATPLNIAINKFLGLFTSNPNWKFDVEHITVINAGVIICLQFVVSIIVKKFKALPTMIVGISFGSVGMAILAISNNIWVFITGIIVFTLGEMTAHPKFLSYVGLIAPEDKKALYLGYSFLYGVIGSGVGGILGAKLYVHFVKNLNQPVAFWLIFTGIGVLTIIGLLIYNSLITVKIQKR